jgi:hypothetical protein
MFPLMMEELARDRERALHREAAARSLVARAGERRRTVRPAPARVGAVRRAVGRLLIVVGARVAGTAVTVAEGYRLPGRGRG